MSGWVVKACFTRLYNLVVLSASIGLLGFVWYWSTSAQFGSLFTLHWGAAVLELKHEVFALAAIVPVFLGLLMTHGVDLVKPRTILTIGLDGLHDARLTRGPIPWKKIKCLTHYRKGWQIIAVIEMESADLARFGDALKFGYMPIFAFNRLCARWLKRPELVIGLGGLTHRDELLMYAIEAHMQTQQNQF